MILKYLAIFLIDIYRYFISPLFPQTCRFIPSCSNYARQSIIKYGFLRGSFLAICRLSKCHPFHPGGIDPVPPLDNQV